MSISKLMKSHEVFRNLSFEEIERVNRFAGTKNYAVDDVVFRRGDSSSHFFVVLEGRVNLKLPSSDRESSLVVGRMKRGDIFGLSGFLGFGKSS